MIKCKPGNKRCGKRCIPSKWNCHEEETPKKSHKLKTTALIAVGSIALAAAGVYFYNQIKKGKPPVIKTFTDSFEQPADPEIKKELEEATFLTTSLKEFNSGNELNPKIVAKIPQDLKIHQVYGTHPVFEKLGFPEFEAMYLAPYDMVIVNATTDHNSEAVARALCYWHQHNKGFVMSDSEYKKVMSNLTPIQERVFDDIQDYFNELWVAKARVVIRKGKSKSFTDAYDKLKRAEFEAFYLTSDWDKLEKTAKEQGLL